MDEKRISVALEGVPETLLWPLYCRAAEARRHDALLEDDTAVELVESIDYPFEERFGAAHSALALRASCFDHQIEEFLRVRPRGTVVALGDGLETQFSRVDNGTVRWLSIDLPEVIELRRRLLPDSERARSIAGSAMDASWMDRIDPSEGLFITAQGLLMYLFEDEVEGLILRCAARFPGAKFMFDAIPRWLTMGGPRGTWLSTLLMRGRHDDRNGLYRLPPMRWGAGIDRIRRQFGSHPSIAEILDVDLPAGRGIVFRYLNPTLGSLPLVRNARPCNVVMRFKEAARP